jgi:hypothetical protein
MYIDNDLAEKQMTTNGSPSSPSWGHKNAWDQPTAETAWGNGPITNPVTSSTGEVFFHFEKSDETTMGLPLPLTKRPLIGLDEWNDTRKPQYIPKPLWNGIACPKCGSEMYDSNPDHVLMSYPPKVSVACACGFHGSRVV